MEFQFIIRYYCQASSDQRDTIVNLLHEIKEKHAISFEIRDLRGDQALEREAYEKDFKPMARLLKKKTGRKHGIRDLRGKRSGRYYVSVPGTITIIKDGRIQWYTLGASSILEFLRQVLDQGEAALIGRLGDCL